MDTMLAFEFVEDTLIVRQGNEEPSRDDWQAFVRDFRASADTVKRVLLWSDGGGFDAVHRKDTIEIVNGTEIKFAVVSGSKAMLGAATAMNWFAENVQGFEPTDFEHALAFLEFDPEAALHVQGRLQGLKHKLAAAVS